MMPTIVKRLIPVMGAFTALPTFAQTGSPDWLVDMLYASGKINTVVVVVAVVLLGIAAWMFLLDRRIGKLEKHK